MASILMIGCFDTKGEDYRYLYKKFVGLGYSVIALNTGTRETDVDFPIAFNAEKVAERGGSSVKTIREENDRGKAVEVMGDGAGIIASELEKSKKIAGAIGMGGSGSTYMILRAFNSLSFGLPKVCLSTVATKDLNRQVGSKDIVLIPSVVDIAGINSISKMMIDKSAAALHGMVSQATDWEEDDNTTIGISIFGNTTPCTDRCTKMLKEKGFEVLGFHANGSGGRTMESLIADGMVDACLEITTTELADELCGGV